MGIEADRTPRKTGGVEIAGFAHLLKIQDGARAIFRRRGLDGPPWRRDIRAAHQGLADHPSLELAFGGQSQKWDGGKPVGAPLTNPP